MTMASDIVGEALPSEVLAGACGCNVWSMADSDVVSGSVLVDGGVELMRVCLVEVDVASAIAARE